jgi:SWI/SNF-related matrix-associated actin-dependent regulator 1 of chromatin subfamily A
MSFQDNYPLPELTTSIPIKGEMYGFQKPGTAYQMKEKRMIVGDDMGLGKTLQTIAAVVALNEFPCLVICPSSLKYNW